MSRVAVVTGGASGVGRSICEHLAAGGASVAVLDLDEAGAANVADGLSSAALARMEGRIALEEVLDRWPTWEVDLDAARRAPTSTVRGWDSMPAVVG
jgi:NAD(P)-dependent dehydrogenase (short-subunit alcohol dehydrogenase family)